jgi:tRNA 2-selenouridine synthase
MNPAINENYEELFLSRTPLLDVRAPCEFQQGAFPGAINLPLMDDSERHAVGLCYKEQGPQAAVALGHELVSGQLRDTRIQSWIDWVLRHPEGQVYCFRGGMRSATVQRWLEEAGYPIPRIRGGYKAMRRYLLDRLERAASETSLILVSGRTGSGKTRVIESLDRAIDLEGLARHRGSAFGRRPGGQPTQIDFENGLAIAWLQLQSRDAVAKTQPVILEDESKLIGHRLIPPPLFQRMTTAPRVVIDEPLESRVRVTLEDYVLSPLDEYARFHGPDRAPERLGEELLSSIDRIRNRLGGQRHAQLRQILQGALQQQERTGSTDAHEAWIRALLVDYYDPLYAHGAQRRAGIAPILFTGTRAEVHEFLATSADRSAQRRQEAG